MNVQDILSHPDFWIAVTAGSEIIALLPIKSNCWVQFLPQVLYALQPKKGLIPVDGRWLLRFLKRSPFEVLNRKIQRRKFEATLKPRINAEDERWHKSQPPAMPSPERIGDLHIKSPWSDDEQ